MLYHFSEDSTIRRFVPHVPQHRQGEVEPLVWAIDWWYQPMYFFPRECPRILLWPIASTSEQDLQRWFDASEARMVAFIERDWLARMGDARLYRYTFAGDEFEDLSDAGMWVSRAVVTPIRVEPVGDLFMALRDAQVELRVLKRLTPLRGVWASSLHASGIRLRNARCWN